LLEMCDYDVILGMDWLAGYHATMDCFHKTLTFKLEETPAGVLFQGNRSIPSVGFVSALKADRLMKSGCEAYLAFITEDKRFQGVEEIPIVWEFPDVFPEEIPGLPPVREIDFTLELLQGTAPISIAPYRMAPAELGELKTQLQELLDKGFVRPSVCWSFILLQFDRLHFILISLSSHIHLCTVFKDPCIISLYLYVWFSKLLFLKFLKISFQYLKYLFQSLQNTFSGKSFSVSEMLTAIHFGQLSVKVG